MGLIVFDIKPTNGLNIILFPSLHDPTPEFWNSSSYYGLRVLNSPYVSKVVRHIFNRVFIIF